MEKLIKIVRATPGIIVFLIILGIGCAQNSKNNSNGNPQYPVAGACPVGQVTISGVGCVPQGSCPPNYGFYNNQCVPGVSTNGQGYQYGNGACSVGQIYTYYGCMPTNGCPANYGMYNTQCMPALSINGSGVPNGVNLNNQYNNGQNGYYNNSYYQNGYYNNSYYPSNGYYNNSIYTNGINGGSYPYYNSYPQYYTYPQAGGYLNFNFHL